MKFNQNYSQPDFLAFLKDFLPDDFAPKDEDIQINATRYKEIKKANVLGFCKSLDVYVLEMQHDHEKDPRLSIATDAFKILADHWIHKALVIFKSKSPDNYRLSLLTISLDINEKNKTFKKYSNPRRYSFFLGPNAKTKTPEQCLIKKGQVTSLEDLKNRFSLEVVNKEFYQNIAVEFTKLVGGKRKEGEYKALLKLPSSTDHKLMQEFAVRFIGRLIFCWFLKKKKSQNDKALIPEELLASQAIRSNKNYYHAVLEPLFFQLLNTPHDERHKEYKTGLWKDIPFLNGGLFEPHHDDFYDIDKELLLSKHINALKIPDEWLLNFFEILETYNFTIDENTTIDVDLSVDPEMLGRIFENLLAEINPETGETARKSTGSYYTQRTIVDFMVCESLKLYLENKTGIKQERLNTLLQYEDEEAPNFSDSEINLILAALEKIKIIDPACGSGAFPMGILQRIVLVLAKLDPKSERYKEYILSNTPAIVRKFLKKKLDNESVSFIHKLGIIRNSIYGVDIQPIAVEIAKLRFFLSLVVDERVDDTEDNRNIWPLPNLEFKFVCANSLIGLPEQKMVKGKKGIQEAMDPLFEDTKNIDQLAELRDQYFEAYGKEKILIEKKYRETQEQLFNGAFNNTGIKSKSMLLSGWNPFDGKPSTWFDPEWMFGIKDGFDIVIGNPPYVGEKGHKELFREIKSGGLGKYHQGKMDYFYFFFHLSLNMGKAESIIAFITTNYYPTATSGKKLREDFKSRATVHSLINFNELRIFESALGQHNMVTILSKSKSTNVLAETCITKKTGYANSEILNAIIGGVDPETEYFLVRQDELFDGEEIYIRLSGTGNADPFNHAVLSKIQKNSVPLGNLCKINLGCHITISKITDNHLEDFKGNFKKDDGVFVLTPEEVNAMNLNSDELKLVKNFIKNSNINRYRVSFAKEKLLYLRWEDNISLYPNIKRHLKKYEKILLDQAKRYSEPTWPWFSIHRPRDSDLFESTEKIILPYRSRINTFGYCEAPVYSSGDVFFMILRHGSEEITPIKYLLSILNSKLYYFWLYHRGKRKGEMLELYQKPLSEIPIKVISKPEQKPFIEIANKILVAKAKNPNADTSKLEAEIDQLVYTLYDLTPEEIKIVEGNI